MSAPFRFKLKVKTGNEVTPGAQPPAPYGDAGGFGTAPSGSQQWTAPQPPPAAPAPAKPFKLKLKVAGGAGNGTPGGAAAAQPPAMAPLQAAAPAPQHQAEQQPWAPSTQQFGAPPATPLQQQQEPWQPTAEQWDAPQAGAAPAAVKQEGEAVKHEPGVGANGGAMAAAPAAAPVIKKFKVSTGKAVAAAPVIKKPIIKFKPPPKQPRDAAAAAAVGAAVPAALPIVRLTVTAGAGLGSGGGPKRPKPKGGKAKAGGGGAGLGKKGKAKAGKAGEPAPRGRPKRARSEVKDRDSDFTDEDELSGDEFGAAMDEPIAPRTFTLRSSHAAAAAAAPSSTGLGLSAGGPAPSDAHTGVSGGAAAMDTAGTEYRDERPLPRAPTGKLPPLPAGPVPPPKKEDIERLLTRCQKKDIHNMFKEPVTEAIAPGYFSVIKQPMDFSTMKAKASKGQYKGWEDLRADMRLMFSNALTYNAEGGTIYNYAKLLMGQCDRILELAMQGKTDFRSGQASITRKHNAAVKAQQRAEREKLRAEARAEQKAAQELKVLRKAGLSSSLADDEDESIRQSYRRTARDPNIARWRGLGGGVNAEGGAWGTGRQVLRPVNPWLPPGMYALSLARFAANLKGRARELVMQRARASTAADEAAERLLQLQLSKKLPVLPPPAVPASAASAAGAPMTAGGVARLPTVGMLQQPSAMQAALGAASAAAGSAASMAAAPAAMLAQQQLLMQAAGGRPPGMGLPGMLPGARPAGAGGMTLPPGATITFMPTPQGVVPFLIQPGQPPMMMLPPGMQAAGQKPGGAALPGMAPGMLAGGVQALMPGLSAPRPSQ
ncbi:hypothetical protein ABPG77_002196 [Micractinium sp. CCAP 211/92]